MNRRHALRSLSIAAGLPFAAPLITLAAPATLHPCADQNEWVLKVMDRMDTIKAGATRKQLLLVFEPMGGLRAPMQGTYVSRECLYFHVDVTFRAATHARQNSARRDPFLESDDDVITSISGAYLGYFVSD